MSAEVKIQTVKVRARGAMLLHSALTTVDMLGVFLIRYRFYCVLVKHLLVYCVLVKRLSVYFSSEYKDEPPVPQQNSQNILFW